MQEAKTLMGRSFNHQRAAMILCDAILMGDRITAEKWGITQRSIQNYRHRLQNDERIVQLNERIPRQTNPRMARRLTHSLNRNCGFYEAGRPSAQK